MPGHIIEGTNIAVDLWTKKVLGTAKYFYFLTHLHADHIEGLSKTWNEPIYTSSLNAELLHVNGLVRSNLVRPLEVGESRIFSLNDQKTFTVTLIDANHCPGSVMFLFEGKFGNVLYTGDFCHDQNVLPSRLPTIDLLYLDNTYCSDKCRFPSRDEAAKEVVKMALHCLQKCQLLILGLDSLGKEELVIRLAEASKMKVFFMNKNPEVLKLVGLDHVTTTDPSKTKIHVRSTREVNRNVVDTLNRIKPTCGILPTARFEENHCQRECPNIHIIPYSCHSSFTELREFVKKVRPKKIMPIVDKSARGFAGKNISERSDMSVFDDLCRASVANSPPPKRARRNDQDILEQASTSVNDNSSHSSVVNSFPLAKQVQCNNEEASTSENTNSRPLVSEKSPTAKKGAYKITLVTVRKKQVFHIAQDVPSIFDIFFS